MNMANNQQTSLSKTINKQQPTPILKTKMVHPTNNSYTHSTNNASASSRKRAHSSSVEFSQEIKIMERKATIDSEEVVESDTDVGSQIDDSFDLDDSFDNQNNEEDTNEDLDAILTNNNITSNNNKKKELSPHKTSQMAAKVRRLNLNSDDNNNNVSGDNTNGSRYSNGSMDVKRAMEIARRSFLDEEEGDDESDNNEKERVAVTKVTNNSKKRIGYAPKHTTTRRSSSPGGGGGGGLFGSNIYSSGVMDEKKMSAARVSNESSYSADMNMAPCSYGPPPPSTIKKKKGRSRLFHDNDEDDVNRGVGEGINVETKFKFGESDMKDEDEDEDVSPRDALDFPFFNNNINTASSSPKRASQKENSLTSSAAKDEGYNNNKSYEAMTSSSSINTNYQSINSPPRFQGAPSSSSSNHPSTAKRSNQSRSVVDRGDMFNPQPTNINLNCTAATTAASSSTNNSGSIVDRPLVPQRPMGLRSIGRANSFLQMFSQGSIDSGNGSMRSIDEDKGGGVNLKFGDNDSDDDDGDDFMLHTTDNRPKPPQRNDSILSVGATITTSDMITCPSPQRPMRKAHRYTPASPVNNKSSSGDANNAFSRFVNDFEIVGTLGNGSFGSVYSVRNRTDQRLYAIKAAKREARNSTDRNRMLQEVFALSSLSEVSNESSMHIVRYNQAWMEGNRLYIQTELCETTLLHEMKNTTNGGKSILLDEKRRYKLLREMLLALDLVHKSNMIHLDIKPENIFIKNNQYKLGDFGLVGKTEGKHDDVEEGDSRYMSPELLSGELDDLTKSDIFSLGATMYEISLGFNPREPRSLPENGQEWQDIRHGILLPMPSTAFDMQMIIREMMSPEWRSRPSAEMLLKKRQLLSDDERKILGLNMALDAQMQRFKQLSPKTGPGTKFKRSNTFC